MTKCLSKSFKEEFPLALILRVQSVMVGKAQWQEHEKAGYRKEHSQEEDERKRSAHFLLFIWFRIPAHGRA